MIIRLFQIKILKYFYCIMVEKVIFIWRFFELRLGSNFFFKKMNEKVLFEFCVILQKGYDDIRNALIFSLIYFLSVSQNEYVVSKKNV